MRTILMFMILAAGQWCMAAGGQIDHLVEQTLRENGVPMAALCTDEVFVRRVNLVLTGRIPSVDVVREFIASDQKDKRNLLIDKLLLSSEFVEYQVLKWGDLLRIKSEFSSNLWPNAVQAYNRWLKQQFSANIPYDRFVQNLLMGTGSNFRVPQINFYRVHQSRSEQAYLRDIAQIFMGQRAITVGAEPFFSQIRFKSTREWKEEILYLDIDQSAPLHPVALPDGRQVMLRTGEDFRRPYIEWLTSPGNPLFARAIVNRVWFWVMGRGIVHECDDLRADNPPSNPQLLSYLEQELVRGGYDLHHVFRLILQSNTFSRSSITAAMSDRGAELFAYYPTQRLGSESIIDAICDVTGVTDRYSSRAPEPFTNFPDDIRAMQICDGTVTTSQLELFGRPSRDTSIESDRNNGLNSKQVLFLLNSAAILDKINVSPVIDRVVAASSGDKELIIKDLYLRALSRYPDSAELRSIGEVAAKTTDNKVFARNLMWALINSDEFIFLH